MARVGRPPVPVERKRLLGNPGKRALPAPAHLLEPALETPTPVRPLGRAGLAMWERTWEHASGWISPGTDIELVQLVCEQLDERVALRIQVMTANDIDDRKALRDLDKQYHSGLAALGLTPTDRTRMGLAEVKKVDKLDKILARRQRAAAD